jgi:hypothetical protein
MKKIILNVSLFLFVVSGNAQTGIGTTTPNASAKLEVFSPNKGFLPPRISLTDAYDQTTIISPVTGLLVYCKGDAGLAAGYYYWNGNAWATIATAGGSGSVAAEFGSQILQAGVTINSGTPIEVISFTLPSSGTWEVITFLRAQGTAGYAAEFAVYDNSNNLVPNSEILPAYGETGSTGTGIVRITTSGSATYKVKAWASGGASYPFNVTTDGNGRTGVTWKKISGNAPVTGQSVDYVSVGSIYLTGVGDSRDLIFSTNFGGNIPYNTTTGVFTLSANKTYLFQAQVRVNAPSASGNYIEYGFVDAVSNALLVNGTQTITSSTTSTAGFGSNPVINFIYTPSSNQTVKLRTTSNTSGTQTVVSGTANIAQIGSSAIVNPWTLSGTNTYNTTGNVGIGTNNPTSLLNIAGGGVRIASGMSNTSTRPSVNTSTIGNYEIRGVGGGFPQIDGQDDGFLRLSAGGGTNAIQQSSIDLSGYSATVPDMNSNIVMRTAGVERLRIDASGNVNVTGKINLTDPTGNVSNKAAAFVDAGTFVTLDNLKATVTTSGTRGLSLATVSGTLNLYVQGIYMNGAVYAYGSRTNAPVIYTTTMSASLFGWSFEQAGDTIIYHLTDAVNGRMYRITLIIQPSYLKNFISIERLL